MTAENLSTNTLSQAQGGTEPPLIELTIGAFFDTMVRRQPDHEALVSCHQGRRYTYAQRKRARGWPRCVRQCRR